MPTAQQLVDMSTELTDTVKSINTIVGKQQLPFHADTTNLSNTAFLLAAQANTIGQVGLSALADDVQGAISQLTTQVSAANSALQQINDVKRALNIVGVVLTSAGSIAASVATGNWIGVAGDVVTLANNLRTAINANQPAAAGAGAAANQPALAGGGTPANQPAAAGRATPSKRKPGG
jgi:hypothetical protein